MTRKNAALGSAERLCRIINAQTGRDLRPEFDDPYEFDIALYDGEDTSKAMEFVGDSWGEVYWTIQHCIEVLGFVGIRESPHELA